MSLPLIFSFCKHAHTHKLTENTARRPSHTPLSSCSFQIFALHKRSFALSVRSVHCCCPDVHMNRYAEHKTPLPFGTVSTTVPLCPALLIKAICFTDSLHEKPVLFAAALPKKPASYFVSDRRELFTIKHIYLGVVIKPLFTRHWKLQNTKTHCMQINTQMNSLIF